MSGPYDDIIDLPHPTSERHPRMPMANRAAQFSPFAALTGYENAVKETARLTDCKVELIEEEKAVLNEKLRLLAEQADSGLEACLTYFQPDGRKAGGTYFTVIGKVKKMDGHTREVVLADNRRIPIDDILNVQFGITESG
ncbi:MAG: YolD-like family protein [Dysosmobacter sp.]|nr:YolD-like family protein [Dysosmobacter sp.]